MAFAIFPALAETAADNYKLYCTQCHGTNMSGGGINSRHLSVEPRNHRSAEDMSSLSDEDLELAIRKGGIAVGKSSQMPPFGALLSDEEIHDTVRYLRKACQCTHTQ
ncbi:MAG: cytochrome c [Proteobacteria bacterium]|nr:cytochrome c [Pseudomonadota bacterium]